MEGIELPEPFQDLAEQNCWTSRRCAMAFNIHGELERNEKRIIQLLMLPREELVARSPYPQPQDDSGAIVLSGYAEVAMPGQQFVHCEGIAPFPLFRDYPRVLILPYGACILFYLHGTLAPTSEMIWDWRMVDKLDEEIHLSSVKVMYHSVSRFLREDLTFYLGRGAITDPFADTVRTVGGR